MAGRRHSSLIPLSHDHREALGLAFRLHHPAPPGPVTPTTPASTPESRVRETLAFFERSLQPHFRAEEDVLFPFLREHFDPGHRGKALLQRLVNEHQRMRALREQLASALSERIDPAPLLNEFADLLETHVRTEERQLFSSFPEDLPPGRAKELERQIRAVLDRET